ncbi:MAG: hypothetical protein ABI237_04710, partial [Ginsengibacter sp.]
MEGVFLTLAPEVIFGCEKRGIAPSSAPKTAPTYNPIIPATAAATADAIKQTISQKMGILHAFSHPSWTALYAAFPAIYAHT